MTINDIRQLSDYEVLSLTLIGEARGEPIEGIIAVGCVVRNRLHSHPASYKGYSDVCLRERQFSCWDPNDSNLPFLLECGDKLIDSQELSDPYLRQCQYVAKGIMNYDLLDNTSISEYYMVTSLLNSSSAPLWSKNRKNEIVKGNHTFFSLKS